MTKIGTTVGTTPVRLEEGFQSQGVEGKADGAALNALGGQLAKKNVKIAIDGWITTGKELAKLPWGDFCQKCRASGLDPKDVVQLLDDINLPENQNRTIDISRGTPLAKALGLADGVDGNYGGKADAVKANPTAATNGLQRPTRAATGGAGNKPAVEATPTYKPLIPSDDAATIAAMSPQARDAAAAKYDREMQQKISVDQLAYQDGSLDFRHNCIASSKVAMLRAAGVLRTDVPLADVVYKAGQLTPGIHFSAFNAGAQQELNATLPGLSSDPAVGAGGAEGLHIVTANRTQAMTAMRDEKQVIMAYVDYEGVGPNDHVVGLYYNPYSGQYMAMDPLRPDSDATPNVFPISMDPKDKTYTNRIRVSHARFWTLAPDKKPNAAH